MEIPRSGHRHFFWWVAWVFAWVPAGALAGALAGFVEFNWGGAPYDGEFLGGSGVGRGV